LPKTRIRSATSPLVMNVLPPDTTILSPSGVKRVASAASAPAATRGNRRRFCSSLPKSTSGFMAWKFVAQMMPVDAQALEISRTQARYTA